mmetsp:Transcript_23593/g.48849  ORF Transcript_23593/g.48849 Transcript_23593/m.48849 type:complete len:113 (+) Transcript_23593:221-559(+)|eukprot:CAMPEP_0178519418 /NCGR_PEP_ID=MMETSP0696-20121128/26815_1 /TAXON_ID=265572 /ORGANISM="Extubocellulus spinifer, Strain CCMP396" /LENGTH=112 /DNA_ID=CAMNT_0020150117 /DNA_START=363 /DNA_END=701 /DNA_ORIENTATION=+
MATRTSRNENQAEPNPTSGTTRSIAATAAAASSAVSNTTSDVSPTSLRPYEEERRILLNSVAESLSRVVNKMGVINARLADTAQSCQEVEQVASVWKEALSGEEDIEAGEHD